jgi:hypothetical protein
MKNERACQDKLGTNIRRLNEIESKGGLCLGAGLGDAWSAIRRGQVRNSFLLPTTGLQLQRTPSICQDRPETQT